MSGAAERNEEATPRRREEARGEGQVAKSEDLSAALGLALGGGALSLLAAGLPARILGYSRRLWDEAPSSGAALALPWEAAAEAQPEHALREALFVSLETLLPIVLVCALAGLLITIAQTGFLFAPKAVKPDAGRLDPVAGAKKLFSPARLMVVVRAAVALFQSSAIVYFLSAARAGDILSMPLGSPLALARLLGSHLPALLAACGLALLLPGAIDLVMARRRLSKELRMTRQEIRDEHKRDEGDPLYKGQRQQAHRELFAAPSRPLKEAKVLLVNPTRLAVALHHGPDLPVPEVGVRGSGDSAARLRKEARALGIPIVRDVPLARALIGLDPGSQVPEPLFAAVAAVLAAVYRAELAAGS